MYGHYDFVDRERFIVLHYLNRQPKQIYVLNNF